MPLNKFIPTSPDLNITKDSDMGMAQFGHLNTIVDYLNTYVVADSLQLEGVGPLSATARYITDSAGNLSSLAISTGNIGIGTTNATARLRVISADTNGIAEFFQNGSVSSPLHLTRYGGNVPINLNTSGGTSASPTPLGDNTAMSRLTTNTYNGSAFANAARIDVLSKGTQSATNYGTNMRFFTTPENTTSMVEVLSILSNGNVQIGIGYLVAGGAKLAIKGSGSTSATTSLLVQNSSASDLFKITDNGQVSIPPINLSSISNLVINAGLLNNSTAVGIDLVGGQYAAQFYLRALGATTAGFPSAVLGKVVLQSPSGLVITSNGAGALSNTDIAVYVYQSKSVHINGFTEVASAVLNAESTTKGFLPPRMTTAQKNLIATPAIGLQIFDTDLNRPCFYNGAWVTL